MYARMTSFAAETKKATARTALTKDQEMSLGM